MSKKEKKPLDPVKQFREWMKNTLRRAFFRFWERTKAIQAARIDRGLYQCASCKEISKIKGMHIDHISPVVEPATGFTNWDTYISRLFCLASNLQLLCKLCHDKKTDKERLERKAAKTGVYKLGRIMPQEQKDKISQSEKGRIPTNLALLPSFRRRQILGTNLKIGQSRVFESLSEAAKVLNLSVGNITTICKGKRKSSKGWTFKYIEKRETQTFDSGTTINL